MKRINKELISGYNIGSLAQNAHKYNWGYTLIIAGSEQMLGAALMCAASALESGSGLVVVATKSSLVNQVMSYRPELMAIDYENEQMLEMCFEKATAIIIGPGLVCDDYLLKVLQKLMILKCPLVIDASALKILKQLLQEDYFLNREDIVLTPHHGEFLNLVGDNDIVKKDMDLLAREFTMKYPKVILVLKGAPTYIYYNGEKYDNQVVDPKFATAGMGDVLAGTIGAISSYHQPLLPAVCTAVYVHSRAASKISKNHFKVTASAVIARINQTLFEVTLKNNK